MNSGVVTAYGPGLSYGTVNKAATFTVVTQNAGEGKGATGLWMYDNDNNLYPKFTTPQGRQRRQ